MLTKQQRELERQATVLGHNSNIMATVEITDRFGKPVMKKVVSPTSIEKAAEKFSEMNPDCYVKVTAKSGEQVMLTPFNMRKDEYRMATGHLDLEDFMEKWMPSKRKINPKLIEQELEAEFKADDIDEDPYANDKPYEDCNGDD